LAMGSLGYYHRVAVGVESVVVLYCVFVGGEDVIESCEGGDEGKEGGFGEVEVSYHCVNDLEFIAGADEKFG